jgi:hypothetical protein
MLMKWIRKQLALRRYRRLRPSLESKYGWRVSYSKDQVSAVAAEHGLDLDFVDFYVADEVARLQADDANHHDSHHHDSHHHDSHHHDSHHHHTDHNSGSHGGGSFDGGGHH